MTRFAYGADPSQFGELSLPAGDSRGTVVLVHGGFWRSRYSLSLGRPLAGDLVARGYAVWNLEYRRLGNGGGWPATFDDVALGIDRLATLDVDTSRVTAIGHSAGGHLAVWAAARANALVSLTAVVSQAGVLCLADCARDGLSDGVAAQLLGGSPDEVPERYAAADPMAAVPLGVRVVCVHSRADGNVPFAYSASYVAASGGSAVLRETFGDHFTLIDPASADWAVVVEELESSWS